MKQQTALFVGDITFDTTMMVGQMPEPDEKVNATSVSESVGGVATNAAIACAISGTQTKLAIAVGDDQTGAHLIDDLSRMGIETSVSYNSGMTSRVVTILEPHGEKRLFLYSGVSMFPTMTQMEDLVLDRVGWVHAAVYDVPVAEHLFSACRDANIPWSLDLEPSTFPDGIESLRQCISGAETIFCNERSLVAMGSSAAQLLMELGAKSVILTQGPLGATLCRDHQQTSITAPPIKIQDTTGAGDCLAGWYVSERLRALTPEQSLNTAVHAATLSCNRAGTRLAYPSRAEVQKFQLTESPEPK